MTESQLKFILALLGGGFFNNPCQSAVMGCVGSSGSLAQRLEGLDGDAAKALVAKEVQKGLDSRPQLMFQGFHDVDPKSSCRCCYCMI